MNLAPFLWSILKAGGVTRRVVNNCQLCKKQTKYFSFALHEFTAQSCRLKCSLGKIRPAGLVWTEISLQDACLPQKCCKPDVYRIVRSLMCESWPFPSSLCTLCISCLFFLRRSLFRYFWNELRDSLSSQQVWIRVKCKSKAQRPYTSTRPLFALDD